MDALERLNPATIPKKAAARLSTNALNRSEFAMLLSATAEEVRALRGREGTREGAADGLINRQK